MAGVVIEKSYAEQQGKNYGTPAGGIMCTGAYELKSWKPGVGVTAVANPHYWNTGGQAAGPADPDQGRAGRLRRSPRPC